MEKNRKRIEEKSEIINEIIQQIREKDIFSDSEIQEYEEELSDALDKLLNKFDKRNEFDFKIVYDPHEYAKMIEGINGRMTQYKGEDCEEEEVLIRKVIGDAYVQEQDGYFKKVDFSLSDLQIRIMARRIYQGRIRSFDFDRIYKVKEIDNIVVYIPKERDERENSIKTYQELLKKEKTQEIENKMEENMQKILQSMMAEIEESDMLTDSLKKEYREKIQEVLKLQKAEFEKSGRKWDKEYSFNLLIKKDPYEYAKVLKQYKNSQLEGILGDCNCSEEKVNFSLGDVQICVEPRYREENRNILLYIPSREFLAEQIKGEIATYQELLENDKKENETRIERLARESKNHLAKCLESNKHLTQEQIEMILNSINFTEFVRGQDAIAYYRTSKNNRNNENEEYHYGLDITSDPDKFSKCLGYRIIGDSVEGIEDATINELPNFSLQQLQVVKSGMLHIYIPEGEYEERDYRELIQKRLTRKLTQQVKEKAKDQLTDEDIDRIVKGMGENILKDIEIEGINDPEKYGEQMMETGKNAIKNISGDTKAGKYENIYVEGIDCFKEQITSMPNFTLGIMQANMINKRDFDNVKSILTIYIPAREYAEKDYQELMHNRKRDSFIQLISKQLDDNIDIEKVKEIADEMAGKVELDKQITIVTNPYEYGEWDGKKFLENNYMVNEISYIAGDTEEVGYYENLVNFSLNIPQIRKIQTISYEDMDINEQFMIYLPNESYIDGATFEDLVVLDNKLIEARELRDKYKSTRYQQLEKNLYEEAERKYEELETERKKFVGYKGEK